MKQVCHITFRGRGLLRSTVLIAGAVICALAATPAGAAPSAVPGSASPAEFAPATAPTSGKARVARADAWSWSGSARGWAQSNSVLPAALIAQGPAAHISRTDFLAALVRIEELRAGRSSAPRPRSLRDSSMNAPALADAPAGSVAARAVALGWMPARRGHFAGSSPITSNEAALAMASVVGLRAETAKFAARLRTEVPGSRASLYTSAQALIRTLGMRYNMLAPVDALELGPTEAVNVAHGAYMLHVAGARMDSWRLDGARRMVESFDLPALGPNQTRILGTALRQLGQPYIWAGETEGTQAEGHGGFDCSGFTIRVVNSSGVPAAEIAPIGERTTFTQSALPSARRIARAALQPADAMFFGDKGPRSTPTQNYHAAVYMGNGWFIHSSGGNGGVAIDSLDGWWGGQYSWGRRALVKP